MRYFITFYMVRTLHGFFMRAIQETSQGSPAGRLFTTKHIHDINKDNEVFAITPTLEVSEQEYNRFSKEHETNELR